MIDLNKLRQNLSLMSTEFEKIEPVQKSSVKREDYKEGFIPLEEAILKKYSIIKSIIGDYLISTIHNGQNSNSFETAIISSNGLEFAITHRCNDKKQSLEYHLKFILDLPSIPEVKCLGIPGVMEPRTVSLLQEKY